MLLLEAIIIGFSAAVVGFLFAWILSLARVNLSSLKNITILFFFTGLFLHVFYEALGANSWYCKHGTACGKK